MWSIHVLYIYYFYNDVDLYRNIHGITIYVRKLCSKKCKHELCFGTNECIH